MITVLRIVSFFFYNNGFFNIFFTQIELKGSGVYGAKGRYLQAGGPAAEAQKWNKRENRKESKYYHIITNSHTMITLKDNFWLQIKFHFSRNIASNRIPPLFVLVLFPFFFLYVIVLFCFVLFCIYIEKGYNILKIF